jgi:hypothetical protein
MTPTLQAHEPFAGYSREEQPLGSYVALAIFFNAAFGTALVAAAWRDRLPERHRLDDVLAVALATHKLARLVTKDSATSFIRAPFVRLDDKSGSNSLAEHPRGRGLRRSIGELLSCPECTGQWIAGGLTAGMLHAPRATRAVTSTFSALAVADLLQFAYAAMKSRA